MRLFEAALDLPPERRGRFLADAEVGEGVRLDAERLLAASSRADAFLVLPAGGTSSIPEEGIEDVLRILEDLSPPPDGPPSAGTISTPVSESGSSLSSIGDYEILEEVGRGGMGVVYRARQRKLNRLVALKVLVGGTLLTTRAIERFRREASATARVRHPNVVPIHDVGERDGTHYYAMEFVEGPSLAMAIAEARKRRRTDDSSVRPLLEGSSVAEIVERMADLADGLAAVHAAKLIHRDIKPSNVIVDGEKRFVLVDFGLVQDEESSTLTRSGTLLGTLPYMAPEQIARRGVDERSDIYSFGVTLFEALTLRRPFEGANEHELTEAILFRDPPSPRKLNKWINHDLAIIVSHALEKEPERRYQSAADLADDLRRLTRFEPIHARPPSRWIGLTRKIRRHRMPVLLGVGLAFAVLLASVLGWKGIADRREHQRIERVRGEAIPTIRRLIDSERYLEAYVSARKLEETLPDDPNLRDLWPRAALIVSIFSEPVGAAISIQAVARPEDAWFEVGTTPLEDVRFPRGVYRWRIEKEGYETVVRGPTGLPSGLKPQPIDSAPERTTAHFHLTRVGAITPGMVAVDGGAVYVAGEKIELGEYWIDRSEVTNEAYQAFVDEGGYARPELWETMYQKDGRTLAWEEAMQLFVDRTGRPGPATWSDGRFPPGEALHPVSGVSWYEATAYAAFRDKELPTIHHWRDASCPTESASIVPYSNFSRDGAAPVMTHAGVGSTGIYDMAGNVREWCSSADADAGERHFLLGAAWGDASYMFTDDISASAWDRSPKNGLRCVSYPGGRLRQKASLFAPYRRNPFGRDFRKVGTISDEEFRVYKTALYSYDRGAPLEPRVESVDASATTWREERVSFNAAYRGERMAAVLRLPKHGTPPYPAVIYFPGKAAQWQKKHSDSGEAYLTTFLVDRGYAVAYPIYDGTYERRFEGPEPARNTVVYRDWVVRLRQDLGRSIDYLITRQDIAADRIAYYGLSWGAMCGPIFLALEDRFRAGVLLMGGLPKWEATRSADEVHFISRVTAPVILIGCELDHYYPVEESQKPLIDLAGTVAENKKLVVLRGAGHGLLNLYIDQIEQNVFDWLERYLVVEDGND